jgi:protein disulfide-isomerase A1
VPKVEPKGEKKAASQEQKS